MNPYAFAGWPNPQNPHSINHFPWRPNGPNPPTFGALPPQAPTSSFRTFEFLLDKEGLFNCDVSGPKGLKYFGIRTAGDRTTITKTHTGPFCKIKWTSTPTLEFVAGCDLASQKACSFLRLSPDEMYRMMQFKGNTYVWLKRGSGDYLVYHYGPNPPENLAQVCRSADGSKIQLRLKGEAFQAGLIEPCIVATILLFSGLNID